MAVGGPTPAHPAVVVEGAAGPTPAAVPPRRAAAQRLCGEAAPPCVSRILSSKQLSVTQAGCPAACHASRLSSCHVSTELERQRSCSLASLPRLARGSRGSRAAQAHRPPGRPRSTGGPGSLASSERCSSFRARHAASPPSRRTMPREAAAACAAHSTDTVTDSDGNGPARVVRPRVQPTAPSRRTSWPRAPRGGRGRRGLTRMPSTEGTRRLLKQREPLRDD